MPIRPTGRSSARRAALCPPAVTVALMLGRCGQPGVTPDQSAAVRAAGVLGPHRGTLPPTSATVRVMTAAGGPAVELPVRA